MKGNRLYYAPKPLDQYAGLKKIETECPYREFMINDEIFKISMSAESETRFRLLWPKLHKRLEAAASGYVEIINEINKALEKGEPDTSELDRLSGLHEAGVDSVIAAAREIINLKLVGEPFDRIFELCCGDITQLTKVITEITDLIKEPSEEAAGAEG